MPNWLRASLFTALFAFVGTFGLALAGWLQQVGDWASDRGATPFPDASVLVYAAVSAGAAAAAFVVNAAVRWAQERGWIPGRKPVYVTDPTKKRARRR